MVKIFTTENYNYPFPLSSSTHNLHYFIAFLAVVLKPGCTPESPKEFLKISVPNVVCIPLLLSQNLRFKKLSQ